MTVQDNMNQPRYCKGRHGGPHDLNVVGQKKSRDCKACTKVAAAAWYQFNKEKKKEYSRRQALLNRPLRIIRRRLEHKEALAEALLRKLLENGETHDGAL